MNQKLRDSWQLHQNDQPTANHPDECVRTHIIEGCTNESCLIYPHCPAANRKPPCNTTPNQEAKPK